MRLFTKIPVFIIFSVCALMFEDATAQSDKTQLTDLEKAMAAYQEKDYDTAISLFTRAAEKGSVEAMLMLGAEFFAGRLDKDTALKWTKMAVAKGDANALVLTGMIEAFRFNKKEASRWFKEAAKKGNFERVAADYVNLACSCFMMSPPEDETDAVIWCKPAAEAGNLQAMMTLGKAYRVLKDFDAAIYWLKKAVEKDGRFMAMLQLAELYTDDASGAYKDEQQAAILYQRAAEKGSVTGMYHVGLNLYHRNNYHDALDWFENALKQSTPYSGRATFYKAECYFKLKDYSKALPLYTSLSGTMASDQELKQKSSARLAQMYREGLGVKKDARQALHYEMNAGPDGP